MIIKINLSLFLTRQYEKERSLRATFPYGLTDALAAHCDCLKQKRKVEASGGCK